MRKLFVFGLAIALLASCKKDSNPGENGENQSYFPLEIGNYWVYQHYNIDALGSETETDKTDSIIVSRDTLINEYVYYILEGTNYPYRSGRWGIVDIVRDSNGYLVNYKGITQCAQNNSSDILASKTEIIGQDTLYTLSYQMENMSENITVPAGIFDVLNYKGTVISKEEIPGIQNPRYLNNYYAKNVGKVLESYFYFNSKTYSEKRLIRYKVD